MGFLIKAIQEESTSRFKDEPKKLMKDFLSFCEEFTFAGPYKAIDYL